MQTTPFETEAAFVPALARHTFTPGGCSNGEHAQPVFNYGNHEGFSESWDGYIYVDSDRENCVIKVSADDNASFSLAAFPGQEAILSPRDSYGGGQYASAEKVLDYLPKGYYKVHVSYENVNYTDSANAARLDVTLDGEQITIGSLMVRNTLSREEAYGLLNAYEVANYHDENCPTIPDVWRLFGDDVATLKGDTFTCATRLSIGLNRAGYYLSGYAGANRVSWLTGTIPDPEDPEKTKTVSWSNAILNVGNPNPVHDHIIMDTINMKKYLVDKFGAPDFITCTDYDAACSFGMGENDVILFHYPYKAEREYGHVGIGTAANGFTEGDFATVDDDEVDIWILQRSDWEFPN